MTPAQIYAAIAAILNIDAAEAEVFANHMMALTLGRQVTDSTSWRTTPPAQRNDLQTAEKMINKLLNQNESQRNVLGDSVSAFDGRLNAIVGNAAEGQSDEAAFIEIGTNLIQAVLSLKNQIDQISSGSQETPLTDEQRAALNSGITAEFVLQLKELLENPPTGGSCDCVPMTVEQVDEIWDRVFNK